MLTDLQDLKHAVAVRR